MHVAALAAYPLQGAALGEKRLRTLSRMRMRDGEPVFGVRYSVQQPGRVRASDRIEPLG
jgi:uncharacterized protein YcbX